MAGIGKSFGKMRQWTGEKVGGSSKTETGDDFNKLQQETEIRREATEKLHEAMQEYLKTYSKRKESAIAPKDKKLSVEILGLAMSNFGNLLDVDSSYGKCLIEYSEFTKDMASRQNEFVAKVREGYSASLSHDIIEIKDYITIKKKLESRRLDFDAKLNKLHKSKKEKPELEEETRIAQMKYEDTLGDITNKMMALNSQEDTQLDELLAFIDAQSEFFKKGAEISESLSKKFKNIPRSKVRKPFSALKRGDSPTRLSYHAADSDTHSRASSYRTPHSRGDSFRDDDQDRHSRIPSNARPSSNYDERSNSEDRHTRIPSNARPSSNYDDRNEDRHSRIPSNYDNNGSDEKLKYASQAGALVFPVAGGGNDQRSRTSSAVPAPKPASVVGKQAKVLFTFTAEGPGELTITKNQQLVIEAEIDGGWWEGTLMDTGARGMFPSNYVEVVPDVVPRLSSSTSTPLFNSSNSSNNTPALSKSYNGPSSTRNSAVTSARPNEVARVADCGVCGCGDYKESAFKPGQCISCYHKH